MISRICIPSCHAVVIRSRALWADAIDRLQVGGGVPNDVQHGGAEVPYQFLRKDWTNAFHEAAAKVTLDALARSRRSGFQDLGLELKPMVLISNPPAFGGEPFAGTH